jgi:hypothetical protein
LCSFVVAWFPLLRPDTTLRNLISPASFRAQYPAQNSNVITAVTL